MSTQRWEARVLDSPGAADRVAAIEVEFRQAVAEPPDVVADEPSD